MTIHTVTLPDGTTATRRTQGKHVYTHVVAIQRALTGGWMVAAWCVSGDAAERERGRAYCYNRDARVILIGQGRQVRRRGPRRRKVDEVVGAYVSNLCWQMQQAQAAHVDGDPWLVAQCEARAIETARALWRYGLSILAIKEQG